jgi:hypothetical protein
MEGSELLSAPYSSVDLAKLVVYQGGVFTAEIHDAEIFFISSAHVHGRSILKYPILQIPADVNPYLR